MLRAETTEYIDSHCHLDFPQFDHDRHEVLQQSLALGVKQLILPGTTVEQWERVITLTAMYPALLLALGLHPLFIDQHREESLEHLDKTLTAHPEVVAIGEIGLDYTRSDHHLQDPLFEAQMNIATVRQLPVLLHVRKAHQQALALLHSCNHYRGIVHAFSGSYEEAKRYIDQGFLLGIGGVATRNSAHKLHKVVKQVPLESLALETDAPDLPPSWISGARNSPEQIPRIAAAIAALRNESVEQIAWQTTKNVSALFSLED